MDNAKEEPGLSIMFDKLNIPDRPEIDLGNTYESTKINDGID